MSWVVLNNITQKYITFNNSKQSAVKRSIYIYICFHGVFFRAIVHYRICDVYFYDTKLIPVTLKKYNFLSLCSLYMYQSYINHILKIRAYLSLSFLEGGGAVRIEIYVLNQLPFFNTIFPVKNIMKLINHSAIMNKMRYYWYISFLESGI